MQPSPRLLAEPCTILCETGSIGGGGSGTKPRNLICTFSVNLQQSSYPMTPSVYLSLCLVPGDARPGAAVVPVDPGAVPARPLVAPANGAVIIIKSIEQ